jgi:hypothetical protein
VVAEKRLRPSLGTHWRLTLRALMALVVLVSVSMTWFVHRARVQHEAVAAIKKAGGIISYCPRPWPVSLVDSVGIDYFSDVECVVLVLRRSDRTSADIGRLTRLRELVLSGAPVTDTYIASLERLAQLECLTLQDTSVTDKGLAHLERLTSLKVLSLRNTPISDAGLVHLHSLCNLGSLFLEGSNVSETGVRHLRRALPQVAVYR